MVLDCFELLEGPLLLEQAASLSGILGSLLKTARLVVLNLSVLLDPVQVVVLGHRVL